MTAKKTQMAVVLESLGQRWEPHPPPLPIAISRTETAIGMRLVPALRELYELADGGAVGAVDLFTLAELADVNARMRSKWKGLSFFASDGSDGFFAVDWSGKLASPAGTVVWVDRGMGRREDVVACAGDLPSFLRDVAAGGEPWRRASLGHTGEEALFAAMDAAPDRWEGRAGLDLNALALTSQRCGVQLPDPLGTLLERTDGMRIHAGGIVLYEGARVRPVEDLIADGYPAALWIGEDAGGCRYAVTIHGWRAPEEGWVVRVAPDDDVATAPLVGRLFDVVHGWLGAGDSSRSHEPSTGAPGVERRGKKR